MYSCAQFLIHIHMHTPYLCMSLQVSILVGELSSQFCDIKQQIDDPFLVCRVHVATCIVNLYSHISNVLYMHLFAIHY